MIEIEEIKNRINKAIKIFYKNDFFLIKNNINERSVTHKLAEYLQREFLEYDIDCEYNRMKNKNMDNEYITKKLDLPKKEIDSYDTKATTVYPDIIIHHRRNSNDNLLVIEVKKEANNKEVNNFDIKKINAYINKLEYDHGLFLKLFKNLKETLAGLDWYHKK